MTESFPTRPQYLNRDMFVRKKVENNASPILTTSVSDTSTTAVARAAARVQTLDGRISGKSSVNKMMPYAENLVKVSEVNGFVFYHWFRDVTTKENVPAPLDEIERLVEEAWSYDYQRSNQARFVYTKQFLEWYSQGDCCDFLLARQIATGELVGSLVLSKRMLYVASDSPRPIHLAFYGTLLTVSPRHRKIGLAAALHDVVVDVLAGSTYGLEQYMGAFDGMEKRASYETGVIDRREKVLVQQEQQSEEEKEARAGGASRGGRGDEELRRRTIHTKTRQIPFWACTTSLEELLRYMPLSSEFLTCVALSRPSRALLEFSFREPAENEKGYTVSLVEPRGVSYPVRGAPETTGFVLNETLARLYGTSNTDVAGTYRVEFHETKNSVEFYYLRHVVVKNGLENEPRTCVQIQIVDRGSTTREELRRALEVVCNEFFFKWKSTNGYPRCIGVLMQNWISIPSIDLLRARFLPSDRKLGFQVGRYVELGPQKFSDNVLFDLV